MPTYMYNSRRNITLTIVAVKTPSPYTFNSFPTLIVFTIHTGPSCGIFFLVHILPEKVLFVKFFKGIIAKYLFLYFLKIRLWNSKKSASFPRRYMAEILAIRRKTLSKQSINQSTKFPIVDPGRVLSVIVNSEFYWMEYFKKKMENKVSA